MNPFDKVDEVVPPVVNSNLITDELIESLKAEGELPSQKNKPAETPEASEEGETAEEPQASEEPAEAAEDGAKAEEDPKPAETEPSKREIFKAQAKLERERRELEPKVKQVQEFDQILAIAKDDPEKLLEATGWTLEKFLERTVEKLSNQENLTPEQKIEKQMEARLKKFQEDQKAQIDIERKQQQETEITSVKNIISKFTTDNAKDYPIIEGEGLQETVFEVLKQTLDSDPTKRGSFTIKHAADMVEKHRRAELSKYFQSAVKDDQEADKTPKETSAPQKTAKPKTITNKVGMQSADLSPAPTKSNYPMTDSELIAQTIAEYTAAKANSRKTT